MEQIYYGNTLYWTQRKQKVEFVNQTQKIQYSKCKFDENGNFQDNFEHLFPFT